MRINAFFKNRLHAALNNPRQSWGAKDSRTDRVFLRVESGSITDYEDGSQWIMVYSPNWRPSGGHKERLAHLEAIKQGADGYAVVAELNDNNKIASFDDRDLLRTGRIVEEDGLMYAEVLGKVSVDDVVGGFIQPGNTESFFPPRTEPVQTTRQQLMEARVGQGIFRLNVLRMWYYQCAVTGITTAQVIRASHIKPWKACTDAERLDPCNGIPLVATLDCLFDRGLIGFQDDGQICISSTVDARDAELLQLSDMQLKRRLQKRSLPYVRYHREVIFNP